MTITGLARRVRSFRADRRGGVAIIFALSLVPMLGLVGLAVDYSRATRVKASMHAAVDATALMLAKEANGLTAAQLQTRATQYFTANFKQPEGKNLVVTPTLTQPGPGRWTLTVKATGKVDTIVMRWASFTGSGVTAPAQLELGSTSTVNWGMKKLELALALDNTGSMAQSNKMVELKKAVKSLLETLKAAEKVSGDIKVSIIPFDTRVRIGTSYKDKPWFDLSICKDYGPLEDYCVANWKTLWDGCVRDRHYPYDGQDTKPDANTKQTLFPVHLCREKIDDPPGKLAEAMPLTADWVKLNTKVDQMQADGATNVTIGLAWAWHSLTTQDPYTEAVAPATDLDKVIILLTDGQNTAAWNNSSHNDVTSTSAIDNRTKLACDNLRPTGIKVYTVRVIDGNADLLRACATKPEMFYDVQQAGDLNAVFTAIANSLANLYIAK